MTKLFTQEVFNNLSSSKPDDNIICYSGFFYKTNQEKLSSWVSNQLAQSSSISNLKKKKSIQDILNHFNTFLESNQQDKFSIQFFLTKNEYNIFILTPSQEEIINEYYKKDYLIEDDTFKLDFWADFFFNDNFQSILEVKKDRIQTHLFTQTKYKEKEIFPIDEIQEKITKYKPLFCWKNKDNQSSSLFSKIETSIGIFDFTNNKSETLHKKLIETTNAFQLELNIKELNKREAEFNKNPDLFIFGNDIIKAIKNYEVKEIFCYQDFKTKIEAKIPNEFLNFKWFIFPSDKKDIGFLEQYKGIIGVRYFVY